MEELEKNKTLPESQMLPKRERKILKKQKKEKERQKERLKKRLKKTLNISLIILILGGAIFIGARFFATKPAPVASVIISKSGLHWHADLSIKILGKLQDIPANIGLGITERYVHTHETGGFIHMEFPIVVREDDIKLGRFFENWGKKFNKDCILNQCNGLEGEVKMFVNGELNFEFENYIMQDGDKIEIIFE